MKKKIEEFDNYGIDLSRSAQHKTHPGGFYSILMTIATVLLIGSVVLGYFTQGDSVSINYIFSFDEYPITPVDYGSLKITGSLELPQTPDSISELTKYFKIVFEYQIDESGSTKIMVVNCKVENNSCLFELPLMDEYFKHTYMNLSPSLGLESCKYLKTILGPDDDSLKDCEVDFDDIYEKEYIKNKFLYFNYQTSQFGVSSSQAKFDETIQANKLTFFIGKKTVHHYISEISILNVLYDNKLFSNVQSNQTYANWLAPKLTDANVLEDYSLRVVFSKRFKDDILYYKIYKTTFFEMIVSLGGLLKLISLLYLVPNIWNEFYMQKALFQVKELYKGDTTTTDFSENELDIDWSKISFCKWYWLTCCCNCGEKKKLIKKKYNKLLEDYQCRSYIRPDSKSKWFDISKLMLQEDVDLADLLDESVDDTTEEQQPQIPTVQDIISGKADFEKPKEETPIELPSDNE